MMAESCGNTLPPVVLKIGGSLLDLPDLAARLRGLFLLLRPAPVAMVVGGGPAADLVRVWDNQFRLSAESAHWLAIRGMRLTEAFVADRLPECVVVENRDALEPVWREGRVAILAVEPLLRNAALRGAVIPPCSWDVTSDALAAWAANEIGARRLVLAKSASAPAGGLSEAREKGLVDRWLLRMAGSLDVEWINLRAEPLSITPFGDHPE